MNICKQCIHATYDGYCDRKQAWTVLNAPACELYSIDPREHMLLNADVAIRAKEKELAAVQGDICRLHGLVREMFQAISEGQHTWGYMRYFREKMDELGIELDVKC